MRQFLPFLLVLSIACNGDPTDATDTDGGDTDVEPACAELPDGEYDARGACFGMSMTVDVTMDMDTCSFTLDHWSMNHGGSAEGGTVDANDVTLTGGDFEGCTGTIDGDSMSGTCSSGCAWELTYAN